MAIWEETKEGSTTFRRPTVKADGTRNQTASELRDVGIRALLGKLPGNWPIIADIGMHIMGTDTDAALAKGKQYLGNVVKGYWDNVAEGTRKATYEGLTDKAPATNIDEYLTKNLTKRGLTQYERTGKYNPDLLRVRSDTQAGRFDSLVPSPDAAGLPNWAAPFVKHPETTAKIAGTTVAAGIPIVGGLALSAFAEGGKPRSSYSNSVDGYDLSDTGSRSSNEYNPSVESAREAARAKTELENLKHAHAKELIELRGEANTPGVQGGSSSVGSSGISTDVDRFLSNVYGSRGTTKYF